MKMGRSNILSVLGAVVLCGAATQVSSQVVAPPGALLRPAETVHLSRDTGTLELQVGSTALHVRLTPRSLRSARFAVKRGDGGDVDPGHVPPSGTFVGDVEGFAGSIVAASLIEAGWQIIIDLGPNVQGERWVYVQPWGELFERDIGAFEPDADLHAVYTSGDLAPLDYRCGGALWPPVIGGPGVGTHGETHDHGYADRSSCLTITELAFDADYEFFQQNGSSIPNTVADIESVLNAVNIIYARDVGIQHVITTVIVRDNPADPYAQTEAGAILSEFATYWQNNHSGVQRDMAHLMTGRFAPNSGVIGVAYLNAVCEYGYGYSRSRYTTNLAFRAGLSAHEMGHNWGAGHCNGDSDCYIMCSGIGGCSNNVTRFGTREMQDIMAFRDTRTCTASGGPYPSPLPPIARNDTTATLLNSPVAIDVLANDADGNCDTVRIQSFTGISGGGGLITRSVGTGPGGRDQLRYAPTAAFSGVDTFTYSAADTSNAQSTGQVSVSVLRARSPVAVLVPQSGLNARYFNILPNFVPEFGSLVPYANDTVPSINFPGIDGNFATSGRAANVAAVFTRTLNIPAAGAYTFFTESDDGSLLYINDRLVVANDGPQGMFERPGVMTLPVGPVSVRVEYAQGGGGCGLIARVQGPGLAKQVIPEAWWSPPGIAVAYYGFVGAPADMPPFDTMPLYSTGVALTLNQATIDNYFASSSRRYQIAARFEGYLTVPTTGLYRLYCTSDDGSEVFIGGDRIVANGGGHGMVERSGYVALGAGSHSLRVDFWQGGGGGGLIFQIEGPGLAKQPVPASMLSRTPVNASDCDSNGLNDSDERVVPLDVGDLLVGGDGSGAQPVARGVHPVTGQLIQPGVFAGSSESGASSFVALDGVGGRLLAPFIDGVFIPNGVTRISRSGQTFLFSPTTGGYFNALRNALSESQPIEVADQPGVTRRGIGLHSNMGVTVNLNAIAAAAQGRRPALFRGVAGVNLDGCQTQDIHIEFVVLVDGVKVYRRVLSSGGNIAEPFGIPLGSGAGLLTFAALDADGNNCDHLVLADAVVLVASAGDGDSSGRLDICECAADFNRDGGVDGQDVEAFFLAWQAGLSVADVNVDGGVTGADVEAFFVVWSAGGC